MSERLTYYYVYGFYQDMDCYVGVRLQKELKPHGIDIEIIDARGGHTRFDCSVSSGVAALEALYEKHKKPLRILGGSVGGFIALIYSAKDPQNVEQLIVLNSVVNFESIWPKILSLFLPNVPPEESMKKWKEEGQLMLKGIQMEAAEPVSYNYFLDSLTYPAYPLLDIPVLALVAAKDPVIPLSFHHEWKQMQKNPDQVKMVEFDDHHGLVLDSSWETITSAIVDYSK